jgi:hypothetical protein
VSSHHGRERCELGRLFGACKHHGRDQNSKAGEKSGLLTPPEPFAGMLPRLVGVFKSFGLNYIGFSPSSPCNKIPFPAEPPGNLHFRCPDDELQLPYRYPAFTLQSLIWQAKMR